jgi:hypothetical protein
MSHGKCQYILALRSGLLLKHFPCKILLEVFLISLRLLKLPSTNIENMIMLLQDLIQSQSKISRINEVGFETNRCSYLKNIILLSYHYLLKNDPFPCTIILI